MPDLDLSALRTELLTGSYASLYSANITLGDYNALSVTLNTPGLTGSSIGISTAPAGTLMQLVQASDYTKLTTLQRDLWGTLITAAAGPGGLPLIGSAMNALFSAVWSASTDTLYNIVAIQTRFSSRAESLVGVGFEIHTNDIYVALNP